MNYHESLRHAPHHIAGYWYHDGGNNDALLTSITGVIVGFGLAVLWDLWKRQMNRREELKRASRAIMREIEVNLRVFKLNSELLKKDDEAADNSQEIVNQLDRLCCAAGESAYLRGSLEHADPELAEKLRNVYAGLASVNYKIEGRELYRATNGAMSNYHSRRKMINGELVHLLSSLEEQTKELQPKIQKYS